MYGLTNDKVRTAHSKQLDCCCCCFSYIWTKLSWLPIFSYPPLILPLEFPLLSSLFRGESQSVVHLSDAEPLSL